MPDDIGLPGACAKQDRHMSANILDMLRSTMSGYLQVPAH